MLIRKIWKGLGGHQAQESAIISHTPAQEQTFARRVGENVLWLLLARFGVQGLMILFTLVISRRLGEVGLGIYALISAVVMLGSVITTFGTDMLIIREIAARRNLDLISPALIIQLLLSAIFICLIYQAAPSLSNKGQEAAQALRLYSLALLPMAVYSVFSAALRGFERMGALMWLGLTQAIIQVALAWLFIQPGSSLLTIAWLLLGAQFAAALLAALLCAPYLPRFQLIWRAPSPAVLALLWTSAPIALLALMKVLYQRLSIYMLSSMEGAALTGWFSAALRIVEASQIGHIALLGALFPLMAQVNHHKEAKGRYWNKQITRSGWLLLLIGTGIAALLFLLAPVLVEWLYGQQFGPSITALRLLAWILVPYSVNIYLSSQWLSAGRERLVASAFGVSLLILFFLNAWWIPRWGLVGACMAVLVAEAIQAIIFLFLSKLYPRPSEDLVRA